jgi:hypothetical protein
MFERGERVEKQREFWMQADQLPALTPAASYRRVEATVIRDRLGLEQFKAIHGCCREHCAHGLLRGT